jgi:hypothetical protein
MLSRASEIGRGLFSKANALWKEGKERSVKMYGEEGCSYQRCKWCASFGWQTMMDAGA